MAERRTIKTGIRHGYTGYTMHKCGCDICRAAFREYKQDYRQRQREKKAEDQAFMQEIKQPPPDPGTWEDEVPARKAPAKKAVKKAPAKKAAAGVKQSNDVLLGINKDLEARGVDESAPGLAALARRLAQICDNPLLAPQAPAAAARIIEIYKELGVQIKPRGNKLASVKALIGDGSDEPAAS